MAIYGYHRTSSEEQHLDRGISEITAYCEANGFLCVKSLPTRKRAKILIAQNIRYSEKIF